MERAGQESTFYWVPHETTHRQNGKCQAHTEALNSIRPLFLLKMDNTHPTSLMLRDKLANNGAIKLRWAPLKKP